MSSQDPERSNSPTVPASPSPKSTSSQRIGPYILGKTLGVGSTGRVKAAVHCDTLQKVAIKIITKDPTKEKENVKLEREITIMKLIQQYLCWLTKSPNILQIYDVYEASKELYLVLEQVEGGELFDYLVKKGRLTETEALYFFQQIIRGVEYCHRYLICHRDLKPENLLLDKDLNVKVADFGMANLQVPTKLMETSCGSPHYASPEIIRGDKYDGPTSDVWSCGVILYALLTGNLPFADDNIRKLLSKVKTGIYTIPDHVSPLPRELLKSMLQLEPSKRPTLKQVMLHPWYTSKPPKVEVKLDSNPFEATAFEDGYPADYQLEKDLLDALVLLGWNDYNALVAALRAKGKNAEKAFYQLLHKRKYEMLEAYNQEESRYEQEGGPIRRADSFVSEASATSRMSNNTQSVETLTSPTNSNPNVNAGSSPGTIKKDLTKRPPSQVKYNSPLATQTKPGLTTINGEEVAEGQAESSNSESKTLSNLGQRSKQKIRKGLAINTTEVKKDDSAPKSAVLAALNNLTVSTPKHRKGQLLQDVIPQSPIISNTPKVSWFQGIFNFKPETYYLLSDKSMEETTQILIQIFKEQLLEAELISTGMFKCKAGDEAVAQVASTEQSIGTSSFPEGQGQTSSSTGTHRSADKESKDGSKVIKFRVEIVTEGDSDTLRVQLVHKQGAFSIFQAVSLGLQAAWTAKTSSKAS